MRVVLAVLLVTATHAWAQAPASNAPAPQASPKFEMPVRNKYAAPKGACAGCAEVRSVRKVTTEVKEEGLAQQPGGLVASIPLGGGKAQMGSSTRVGDEAVRTTTQWEVTLRYDDGRFRLMMLDKQPDFAEGDRVRIDSRGQILPP
jgi:outer membrane lipoprotein SlyB